MAVEVLKSVRNEAFEPRGTCDILEYGAREALTDGEFPYFYSLYRWAKKINKPLHFIEKSLDFSFKIIYNVSCMIVISREGLCECTYSYLKVITNADRLPEK